MREACMVWNADYLSRGFRLRIRVTPNNVSPPSLSHRAFAGSFKLFALLLAVPCPCLPLSDLCHFHVCTPTRLGIRASLAPCPTWLYMCAQVLFQPAEALAQVQSLVRPTLNQPSSPLPVHISFALRCTLGVVGGLGRSSRQQQAWLPFQALWHICYCKLCHLLISALCCFRHRSTSSRVFGLRL